MAVATLPETPSASSILRRHVTRLGARATGAVEPGVHAGRRFHTLEARLKDLGDRAAKNSPIQHAPREFS